MLRTVKLYGELGKRFGREHRLDVATPAEAIRALTANFPEFERAVIDHPHGFHVLAGRDDRGSTESIKLPVGADDIIKIVPATAGSKQGLLQTIIGATLIVIGVFTGQFWLVQIGASLALGGIAQMLTPVPKAPSAGQDGKTQQSYIFSGPLNTSVQGGPVPIGYGRMIIGSTVISQGLTVRELPT